MKTKTKNRIAGIILAFCALAIIVSAILIKNSKNKINSASSATTVSLSSTTASASQTATQTAGKTDNPLTYKNTDYGFQVTFPTSMNGFTVKKTTTDQEGVIAKYSVLLPTSDKNYKNVLDSKAIAMEIIIYNPTFWAKPDKEVHSSEITKNDKYVYAYSIWEEAPSDLKTITDKDFVKAIDTFKLTN